MISIPVRSPRCTVRSKDWPANGFLMNGPVRIAIEQAARLVFELDDAPRSLLDQFPGQFLVVDPRAAFDGVGEMPIERIGRIQHGVVPALHHARAAALSEQSFDGDHDLELRDFVRVQRRQQAGAAGADDQNIGFDLVHHRQILERLDAPPRPHHSDEQSAAVAIRAPRRPMRL